MQNDEQAKTPDWSKTVDHAEQASELARLQEVAREQSAQVAENSRKLVELQAAFVDLRRAAADRDEAHRRTYKHIVFKLNGVREQVAERNYGLAEDNLAELLGLLPDDAEPVEVNTIFNDNLDILSKTREAREAREGAVR